MGVCCANREKISISTSNKIEKKAVVKDKNSPNGISSGVNKLSYNNLNPKDDIDNQLEGNLESNINLNNSNNNNSIKIEKSNKSSKNLI